MRIAILGGGFTGLTAAYELQKKGHSVTLYEKERMLGGLAAGFRVEGWDWTLERAYHHVFSNDYDILNFAKDIGFDGFFFREPETASIYFTDKYNFPYLPAGRQVIPVDTPQDFLRFPLLPMQDKLRSACILAFLKFSPFLVMYERQTAEEFLRKNMGERAWVVLWEQLFRKKFGKYAGNILTSFIWARIKKRTKKLGYVRHGFQSFVDFLEKRDADLGVDIRKGKGIESVAKKGEGFMLDKERYDTVVSTLPTKVMINATRELFPASYIKQLSSLEYLHAVNLILETEDPILEKTYWLNSSDKNLPFMVVVQHTNFIDKQYYGENHIAYIGKYVDGDDKLLKMERQDAIAFYGPHINTISTNKVKITKSFLLKAGFAQPIYDRNFLKNKPDFITPAKNFYIANLDMTYPYDRGTNYAVKLGKEVARFIL